MDNLIKPIVAIHQPNYFPWLGYFLKMSICDVFIIHDNVQLNSRSYTRRCHINGQSDIQKLSIPLEKTSQATLIKDVRISKHEQWRNKHLKTIQHTYSRAPQFNIIYPQLEQQLFQLDAISSLTKLNLSLINWVGNLLELNPDVKLSSDLSEDHIGSTDENHLSLIKLVKGNTYISGLGAKAYQDDDRYHSAGIELRYLDSYDLLSRAFPEEEIGLSCVHMLMKYEVAEIQEKLDSLTLTTE